MKRTILILALAATQLYAQQQFTTEERLLIIQNALLAEQAASLDNIDRQIRQARLQERLEEQRQQSQYRDHYQWQGNSFSH